MIPSSTDKVTAEFISRASEKFAEYSQKMVDGNLSGTKDDLQGLFTILLLACSDDEVSKEAARGVIGEMFRVFPKELPAQRGVYMLLFLAGMGAEQMMRQITKKEDGSA